MGSEMCIRDSYNSRPYKKLEDLLNLKGMGPKLLKKIQKYLSI